MLRDSILRSNPTPFAYRISYVANLFAGSVYRELAARHQVARSEFVVVFCLRNLGELMAQDIAQITGRPKNSISRAVNALLQRKLIARQVDPADARRAPLSLTRQGVALYDAALPLFKEREQAMLAPLTTRERETLDRLLAKLVLRDATWAGDAVDE